MCPLETNYNEILIKIHTFSFKKMHLKQSSAKWWPLCLGLCVKDIQEIRRPNSYCIIWIWSTSCWIAFDMWGSLTCWPVLSPLVIYISFSGWGTAGILQSTPPVWELQDRKWHLKSSVHKQKCLTLTTPALASWRPKNDVTMKCADLWQGYQRGLIIHYDAHARRFRKAQVISSSADLRWTHIGPRQEGLRGKVCEKVYHDKFINGRRDF